MKILLLSTAFSGMVQRVLMELKALNHTIDEHYDLDKNRLIEQVGRFLPDVSECRRARDAKRDIPVPLSPCARATTCTCRGRPAPGPRLRHFAPPPDPYDEWLDGVSDALASGLRQLRDLRPLRHFGQPLAPTPTADYPPRASRFPGGQRLCVRS